MAARVADDQVTVSVPTRLSERTAPCSNGRPLSRLAVLRQEVVARARIRGLHAGGIERMFSSTLAATPPEVPASSRNAGSGGPDARKRVEAARHGCEDARAARWSPGERPTHVQVSQGRSPDIASSTAGATSRRLSSAASPRRARRSPSCANTSATCLVLAREAPARAQRAIERFVDETRHLGFVGHVEPRIEVGLERKFTQQRQAEGVDGADRDVVGAVAQLAPAAPAKLAAGRPRRAAWTMIRSRISVAALRVKVIARMFDGSTPARSRLI